MSEAERQRHSRESYPIHSNCHSPSYPTRSQCPIQPFLNQAHVLLGSALVRDAARLESTCIRCSCSLVAKVRSPQTGGWREERALSRGIATSRSEKGNENVRAQLRSPGRRNQKVRKHWGWFLILGIALAVLGVSCVAFDVTATFATVLVFGWLLLIGAVFQFVHAFRTGTWSGTLSIC